MFLSPFFFQNFGCHLYIPAFCDTTWVLSKKSYLPPLPNHLCINLAWPTSSDLEKTCQELETPPTPPPPPHTHTHYTHLQYSIHVRMCTCIQSSVRKMLACQENRDPPPPPHTHTYTTHTVHMHTVLYSHLSGKCLLVRKIETPPPTHTHTLHIQYTCIQYYTVIRQENACLSGRWRPPTHIATLHMQYTTHTVHMHTVLYSHPSGKCLLVRKMETPHTHSYATHAVHYTYSTHAYSTIQSSVRKMLACQEDGDPPHT